MMGLLAQTNAYIREAERHSREAKAQERQWKRPIALIDALLHDLEELNLKGQKRVPLAYERRLQEIIDLAPSEREFSDQLSNLKVKIGIGKLMDTLFAIEEALFARRYGPSFDLDAADVGSDLITAA